MAYDIGEDARIQSNRRESHLVDEAVKEEETCVFYVQEPGDS
jgi:hypothetical protein